MERDSPPSRSEEHTSELQSLPTRRSSDLRTRRSARRIAAGGAARADAAATRPLESAAARSAARRSTAPLRRRQTGWPALHRCQRHARPRPVAWSGIRLHPDRKSTRLNSSHSLHDALPIFALADLHAVLRPGAPLELTLPRLDRLNPRPREAQRGEAQRRFDDDKLVGRLFTGVNAMRARALLHGAGFASIQIGRAHV